MSLLLSYLRIEFLHLLSFSIIPTYLHSIILCGMSIVNQDAIWLDIDHIKKIFNSMVSPPLGSIFAYFKRTSRGCWYKCYKHQGVLVSEVYCHIYNPILLLLLLFVCCSWPSYYMEPTSRAFELGGANIQLDNVYMDDDVSSR